jgi:muconolactone delta-isomerase
LELSLRGIVLRLKFLSKLSFIFSLLLLLAPLAASMTVEEAGKLLPDQVGEYRAAGEPYLPGPKSNRPVTAEGLESSSTVGRVYSSSKGESFKLTVNKTRKDTEAYALLIKEARAINEGEQSGSQELRLGNVGTASITLPSRVLFFKGPAFVSVERTTKASGDDEMIAFARLFAEGLDKGEGDIPVLVRHLPDWEKAQQRALYATTLDSLKSAVGNQPVLDTVTFEGGAEAVTATYGPSRLVIIENMTPQLATDNHARIQGRIQELRAQGQSVPSAYERVGNYSVFVFDAPDEQTAAQLIKSISYEQVVQWLGDNPRALERAQRQYTETTAGIIVAVLKASGLSILLCLGIGGLFGGLVFRHRRAQQVATAAYSDAGDMVRLNIDGMSAQQDPARLLGRGEG